MADKLTKEGVFANVIPSLKEQAQRIEQHRNMALNSLVNSVQILMPPVIKGQAFPCRIFLTESPQGTTIELPRKAKYFIFQQCNLSFPPAQAGGGIASPNIGINIEGVDKFQNEKFIDSALFTSPGQNADPANADLPNYKGSFDWNVIYPREGLLNITISGFDGTDPEFIDLCLIGKVVFNQKLLTGF